MYATLFDDPGLINRMLPRYLAVTPEAIRDVAAAVFRPDNRVVLTYLPEGTDRGRRGAAPEDADRGRDRRGGGGMSTTLDPQRDGPVVAERPDARHAPPVRVPDRRPAAGCRTVSRVLVADLPGRPLVSASIVVTGGAVEEPAGDAGATVLAARALTEGTERYDAIALVEAAERLGRLAPRRRRLGRPDRRRRRAGRAARRRPSSCSPRSCSTRPSRTPRSSGCATSA